MSHCYNVCFFCRKLFHKKKVSWLEVLSWKSWSGGPLKPLRQPLGQAAFLREQVPGCSRGRLHPRKRHKHCARRYPRRSLALWLHIAHKLVVFLRPVPRTHVPPRDPRLLAAGVLQRLLCESFRQHFRRSSKKRAKNGRGLGDWL